MVQGQQPLLQRDQDKGDGCGLQEKEWSVVEQVESFRFLGIHITNRLSWSKHTKTVVKRAWQNLFPFRRKDLDLYTRRCQRKALKIVKDSSHPSHRLFSLLPHGKRYRSTKSRSKRLLKQLQPPSHKTPEHLIKWLPRLFAFPLPPILCCC